jgi:hypothetical protein
MWLTVLPVIRVVNANPAKILFALRVKSNALLVVQLYLTAQYVQIVRNVLPAIQIILSILQVNVSSAR